MKKLSILISCLAFLGQISAQTPHKDLGIKESEIEYLTLSDGRYDEYHGYKDFERVGSAVIDMRTKEIAYFINKDSLPDEGMFEMDMTTRFLTKDPMAEKYYEMSPYGYCANNPIGSIDVGGRFVFKQASAYPELARILQNINSVLDNSTIMSNLQKFSGLSADVIRQQFTYGAGPEIQVNEGKFKLNDFDGLTSPDGKTIYLNSYKVNHMIAMLKEGNLDEYNDYLFYIVATILHEYNHSGDLQIDGERSDPNQTDNCLGYQFEKSTFGMKFFSVADVQRYKSGIYKNNSVETQKKESDADKKKREGFWNKVMSLAPGEYNVVDGNIVPKK